MDTSGQTHTSEAMASKRSSTPFERPTLHTLVFGGNIIGLTRVLIGIVGPAPTAMLALVYMGSGSVAIVLGRLASAERIKDRAPRLFTSTLSVTALVLCASAGAFPPGAFASQSNVMAAASMSVFVVGTTLAEIVHRASGRARNGADAESR